MYTKGRQSPGQDVQKDIGEKKKKKKKKILTRALAITITDATISITVSDNCSH